MCLTSSIYILVVADNNKKLVTDSADSITKVISDDLTKGENEAEYMLKADSDLLNNVIVQLKLVGASNANKLSTPVDVLSFPDRMNKTNVLKFQKSYNKTNLGHIAEDGICGKETLKAFGNFMGNLATGTFPSLTIIDPLQSDLTGVVKSFKETKGELKFSQLTLKNSYVPLFKADKYYFNGIKDYTHLNFDFGENPTKLQTKFMNKFNHMEITPESAGQ